MTEIVTFSTVETKHGSIRLTHFRDGSLVISFQNPSTISTHHIDLEEARELVRKTEDLIAKADADRDDYIGDEP